MDKQDTRQPMTREALERMISDMRHKTEDETADELEAMRQHQDALEWTTQYKF